MTWHTSLGRMDTLVGIPDAEGAAVDYAQLLDRARSMTAFGVPVVVASLDDIITSKEYARRRKDAEALPELRRLRAEQEGATEPPAAPQRSPQPPKQDCGWWQARE